MAERKKSGNIFGGSLLNVDGQGIYTVKKFQLILNKSRKSFVLEPTPTPTPSYPIVTALPTPSNEPTPTPTETPTPTPTPTPVPPTIVAFGSANISNFSLGGYSLDYQGKSWTSGNTSTPNGYSPNLYKGLFYGKGASVATDGNMWVVGGEYWDQGGGNPQFWFSLGYSYDGISWTGITNSAVSGSSSMSSIAYGYNDVGNPLWVAVSSFNNSYHWSFDGLTWNWGPNSFNVSPNGVYFGKKIGVSPLWLMVGDVNPDNFAYSSDGQNWATALKGKNFENFKCVAYSDTTNTWILGCDDAGFGTIYISNDGENFNESVTPPTFTVCRGVAFSSTLGGPNGRWVAVGDTDVHYSDDSGISWVSAPSSSTYVAKGHSVCWNGQYFIMVGEPAIGTEIAYSPDGDEWFGSINDGDIFSVGLTVASIPGPDMYPPR
jgi:hypothetical protein